MNCALFAKMDNVFIKKSKTLKKYWKSGNDGKPKVTALANRII